MKNAMTAFLTAESLKKLSAEVKVQCAYSDDLARIAKAFGELQDARHLADYDSADSEGKVGPSWATEYFDKAKLIFDLWGRAQSTDAARLFLAAIVFGGRWTK